MTSSDHIYDVDGNHSLPPRPQMPRDEDCCRSDCANCVFTLYERELERWEQAVADLQARRKSAGMP